MAQTPTHPALEHHPIYLDYNATTPLDPAVVTAMRPYLESSSAILPAAMPMDRRRRPPWKRRARR